MERAYAASSGGLGAVLAGHSTSHIGAIGATLPAPANSLKISTSIAGKNNFPDVLSRPRRDVNMYISILSSMTTRIIFEYRTRAVGKGALG